MEMISKNRHVNYMFIYNGQKFANRCTSIIFVLLTITGKKKKECFQTFKECT